MITSSSAVPKTTRGVSPSFRVLSDIPRLALFFMVYIADTFVSSCTVSPFILTFDGEKDYTKPEAKPVFSKGGLAISEDLVAAHFVDFADEESKRYVVLLVCECAESVSSNRAFVLIDYQLQTVIFLPFGMDPASKDELLKANAMCKETFAVLKSSVLRTQEKSFQVDNLLFPFLQCRTFLRQSLVHHRQNQNHAEDINMQVALYLLDGLIRHLPQLDNQDVDKGVEAQNRIHRLLKHYVCRKTMAGFKHSADERENKVEALNRELMRNLHLLGQSKFATQKQDLITLVGNFDTRCSSSADPWSFFVGHNKRVMIDSRDRLCDSYYGGYEYQTFSSLPRNAGDGESGWITLLPELEPKHGKTAVMPTKLYTEYLRRQTEAITLLYREYVQ